MVSWEGTVGILCHTELNLMPIRHTVPNKATGFAYYCIYFMHTHIHSRPLWRHLIWIKNQIVVWEQKEIHIRLLKPMHLSLFLRAGLTIIVPNTENTDLINLGMATFEGTSPWRFPYHIAHPLLLLPYTMWLQCGGSAHLIWNQHKESYKMLPYIEGSDCIHSSLGDIQKAWL